MRSSAAEALQKFIAAEINPHVDQWEEDEIFPAHEVFKKMGDLGFLGLTKPAAYGGQELDYSYAMVMAEELGHINCGSVPMAIGVQTDMATPALARFGSDALRREFLAQALCLGAAGRALHEVLDVVTRGEDAGLAGDEHGAHGAVGELGGDGARHENPETLCHRHA